MNIEGNGLARQLQTGRCSAWLFSPNAAAFVKIFLKNPLIQGEVITVFVRLFTLTPRKFRLQPGAVGAFGEDYFFLDFIKRPTFMFQKDKDVFSFSF
jgi:hypothetical protein